MNSSFILRNLLIRGLIERGEKKGSGYLFQITPNLLAHLGATRKEELTDFARITDALENFGAENLSDTDTTQNELDSDPSDSDNESVTLPTP